MPYAWYAKLRNPPSLKTVPTMSVHSANGHDLCPIGMMCCEITIGTFPLKHTFIVWKKVFGLDMQWLNHLGCSWTDNG